MPGREEKQGVCICCSCQTVKIYFDSLDFLNLDLLTSEFSLPVAPNETAITGSSVIKERDTVFVVACGNVISVTFSVLQAHCFCSCLAIGRATFIPK